jgi:hypothetical protein
MKFLSVSSLILAMQCGQESLCICTSSIGHIPAVIEQRLEPEYALGTRIRDWTLQNRQAVRVPKLWGDSHKNLSHDYELWVDCWENKSDKWTIKSTIDVVNNETGETLWYDVCEAA